MYTNTNHLRKTSDTSNACMITFRKHITHTHTQLQHKLHSFEGTNVVFKTHSTESAIEAVNLLSLQ